MNVVNISAGVRGPRSKELLSSEADRALFEGVTFVAAAHNHGLAAYPANLSSVLTVTYDNFQNTRDFRYRTKEQVELEAHGIYVENAEAVWRDTVLYGHQLCLPACHRVCGPVAVGLSGSAAVRSALVALSPGQAGRGGRKLNDVPERRQGATSRKFCNF